MNDRIREEHQNGDWHISIAPRRSPSAILFALFFAPLTGVGYASVLLMAVRGPSLPIPAILLLCAGGAFALFWIGLVGLNGLWSLWGHWDATITEKALDVDMELLSFHRFRSYQRSKIVDVRIHETRHKGMIALRTIVFTYEGRNVYVTPALSKEEAASLFRGPFHALELRNPSTR